jgi:hypothetical protein
MPTVAMEVPRTSGDVSLENRPNLSVSFDVNAFSTIGANARTYQRATEGM